MTNTGLFIQPFTITNCNGSVRVKSDTFAGRKIAGAVGWELPAKYVYSDLAAVRREVAPKYLAGTERYMALGSGDCEAYWRLKRDNANRRSSSIPGAVYCVGSWGQGDFIRDGCGQWSPV